MARALDLRGRVFGRLTAIQDCGVEPSGARRWLCACVCGVLTTAYTRDLRSGNTASCGCWRRENARKSFTTHGRSKSSTFVSWQAMLQRCGGPSRSNWPWYGGRGIRVCDAWRADFTAFLADMGERPEGTSIDRINNAGNYEPSNCRWATLKQQSQNRRARK